MKNYDECQSGHPCNQLKRMMTTNCATTHSFAHLLQVFAGLVNAHHEAVSAAAATAMLLAAERDVMVVFEPLK